MLTKFDIETFGQQLRDIIAETRAENATTRDSRSTVTLDQQSVGRLSRMDAMQQQAMAKATHARRLAQATRAKAALDRIDRDEFGFCLDCDEEIAIKRLQHDPTLPLCITCSQS